MSVTPCYSHFFSDPLGKPRGEASCTPHPPRRLSLSDLGLPGRPGRSSEAGGARPPPRERSVSRVQTGQEALFPALMAKVALLHFVRCPLSSQHSLS